MNDAQFLAGVPLFEGLGPDEIGSIARHAVTRRVSRGETLVREGERPNSLYILRSGHARVLVGDASGRELVLTVLGPRDVFGELALIDGEPRSASVIASEDADITVLSREAFVRCLGERPEIAITLLRQLSQRVRELTGNLKEFALLDVHGRLCHLLVRLARAQDGESVVGPVTQQELADRVGASREMVSRVLAGLRNAGLVRTRGRRITLSDALVDAVGRGDGASRPGGPADRQA